MFSKQVVTDPGCEYM